MNKTIALREYNKRGESPLDSAEFDLIESMKLFSEEKIHGTFMALTGREISVEDIKLAILIIELSEALTPPTTLIRDPRPGDSPFNWPVMTNPVQPYRQTFGDGVVCRSNSPLDTIGSACDL